MCLYLQSMLVRSGIIRVHTVLSVESPVKDISWEEGSDYITVTTNSEVTMSTSVTPYLVRGLNCSKRDRVTCVNFFPSDIPISSENMFFCEYM